MFYLLTPGSRNRLRSCAKRAIAQSSINQEDIKSLSVALPSVLEQQNIVQVLQTARQAIQARHKEIELERERKAALMQHLFRYGTRNEPTKQSEIGEMPESWEAVHLGDKCTISTGTTPTTDKPDYYNGNTSFIKTSEIANNRIQRSETHISEEAVREYNLKVYPPGTVFMAMYGQGKTRGQVALLEIPAATSQNTAAIIPGNGLSPEFLWQWLMSKYDNLREAGSQGHISHLNLGYVKQFQVPIPPPHEQTVITDVLNHCDSTIAALEKELSLHEEFFRALLDELMTGRLSALPLVE